MIFFCPVAVTTVFLLTNDAPALLDGDPCATGLDLLFIVVFAVVSLGCSMLD